MHVKLDKIASVMGRVPVGNGVEVAPHVSAERGAVVVVEALEEKDVYGELELLGGRLARIIKGDLIAGVRMDVAAFVGVAPRGPVRVPLFNEWWRDDGPCVEPQRPRRRTVAYPVESFDEYRRLFGGFEGPGLLPFAVATFFEQGGRRAYIARVVHDYGNAVDRETFEPLNEAGDVLAVKTSRGHHHDASSLPKVGR